MRLIIGFVCIAFIEVAVTVLLTKYFGAMATYSLFAIPTITGLFIQWRRRPVMFAAWEKVEQGTKNRSKDQQKIVMSRRSYIEPMTELFSYWISIFLLAIPGPLTAAVAFSLMTPFVRKRISRSLVKDAIKSRRELKEKKLRQES